MALGLPRGGVSPPRWARPFSSRGEEALHSAPEEAPSSGGRQGKKQEEDACFGPLSMRTLCPRPGLATTVLTLLAACWSADSCFCAGPGHCAWGLPPPGSPPPPCRQGFDLYTAAGAMLLCGRADHNTSPGFKTLQVLPGALKIHIITMTYSLDSQSVAPL